MRRTILLLALTCVLAYVLPPAEAITAAEKQELIDKHNYYRSNLVALGFPAPATPLPNVVWNDNLATVAANYATQCTTQHNSQRTAQYEALTHTTNEYVGENLAWGCAFGSGAAFPTSASVQQYWYNEKDGWTYSPTGPGTCTIAACGHWTQVIWADTLAIGCEVYYGCTSLGSACSGQSGAKFTNIVCNYNPGGNYNNQPPYIAATSTPNSNPPTSNPPTSNPPTSNPPTSNPPTSNPPTSTPPTSTPPTSTPPTSTPTSTPPSGAPSAVQAPSGSASSLSCSLLALAATLMLALIF